MQIFPNADFDNHEQVVFAHDESVGPEGDHRRSTPRSCGPALGGCRIWDYATEAEAVTDALRLSRGMTYKAALAGPRARRRKVGHPGRRAAATRRQP